MSSSAFPDRVSVGGVTYKWINTTKRGAVGIYKPVEKNGKLKNLKLSLLAARAAKK